MPQISINISDYDYWKLLGSGENMSTVIQKALEEYWKETAKGKRTSTVLVHK